MWYPFGIVLCELTSRILPFSDTHKRFDFIEAVLEEGAMPTIPRWCEVMPAVSQDDGEDGTEPNLSSGAALGLEGRHSSHARACHASAARWPSPFVRRGVLVRSVGWWR